MTPKCMKDEPYVNIDFINYIVFLSFKSKS